MAEKQIDVNISQSDASIENIYLEPGVGLNSVMRKKKLKITRENILASKSQNMVLIQILNSMKNLLQFNLRVSTALMSVLLMFAVSDLSAQCAQDGTSPVFSNCPTTKTLQLDPGQCLVSLNPLISATDNCPGKTDQYSNTVANTLDGGYGCDLGETRFYQKFTSMSPTPMEVTDVNFSVYQASTGYQLQINVYITDNTLQPEGWTLIGSTFKNVSNPGPTSAAISTDKILQGEEFAIEIVVPSSINDTIIGYNGGAQSAPTYVSSQACNINGLTDLSSVVGATACMMGYVTTMSDPVVILPTGANIYDVSHYFEEGLYNLTYMAVDASGNSSTCAMELTVLPVSNPVSSITCNDNVNVSLDDECTATVTADDILEGGPYLCYDNYIVEIYNEAGQSMGNKLDASDVGNIYTVQVTGPNSNSCWGQLTVEDKGKPVFDCFPVYTTCSDDLEPGSLLPNKITYAAEIKNPVIDDVNPSSNQYSIDVFGSLDVSLTSVEVRVSLDHAAPSELNATLEGPNGNLIWLFTGPGAYASCVNPDMMVTFSDSATQSHADLKNACEAVSPAIEGIFRPQESFNVFNGIDPTGEWVLTINDMNGGNGGEVKSIELVLGQTGARLPFPTMSATTSTKVSPNTYRVTGIDPCGPITASYVDSIAEMSCSSVFSKIISRKWSAVDESGNTANTCNQLIYVYRNGLATLQFPPNYDGIDEPTLSCSIWGMTIPPPTAAGTGMPTGDFCDNVQIFEPEDTKLDVCAKSYKLLREWKVIEWCNNEVIEHTQIIKVEDKRGPSIDCPADMTISTDPLDCHADYTVDDAMVDDYGCSSEDQIATSLSYYVSVNAVLPNDAIFKAAANKTVEDMPVGVTYVKNTATDDCGNMSECTFKITVEDQVPPVAVCDQFTNVSIGSDGTAIVDAVTFDDYSYDNCEIDYFKARKMTNTCSAGNTAFSEKIVFCCEEVGTSVMVAFQVTDKRGLSNTCMVEAYIEDKLPPYIVCPDNITIDCYEDFTNLDITGEPESYDNCEVVSEDFRDTPDHLDNCGEGVIRRTWEIKDPTGKAASCVQFITVEDQNPFTEKDIDWPDDYDATTCDQDLSPDNLPIRYAFPRWTDKNCSLVSYEYEDQVFTFVDGACEKIIRTWTVIDWCTYNKDNNYGLYTDRQIIKLTNNLAPEITDCNDNTQLVYGDCEGDVSQFINATDDCTPVEDLQYHYIIDEFNDGIGPFITGSDSTWKHNLAIGVHKVTWEVTDKCGNVETCMNLVTVRDGKKPSPYCLTTVTTVVMPSTGSIEIWASDFDYGSYDNCTPQEELEFSFTANKNNTNATFTCEDIPDGQEMFIPITMWVHDNAGNSDFCSIGLILQDGIGDVCEDINRHVVSGRVATEQNQAIKESMVMASTVNDKVMVSSHMTSIDGNYAVDITEGSDVKIEVEKADDIMNGVSTLDLVMIQRHILGLDGFDSPYKVIASDVNNDSKITASDLVALRKVILGIENKFPNGQKVWRFADADQTFSNNNKPFPFNESFTMMNVTGDNSNMNFVGMKVGDVNGSVSVNAKGSEVDNRNLAAYSMSYDFIEDNEYVFIDIYGDNEEVLSGLQAGLSTLGGTFVGVEPGVLSVDEGDFYMNDEIIKIAYASRSLDYVGEDEVLFTLIVKKEGAFGGLQLAAHSIAHEVYTGDYETKEIDLLLRSVADEYQFALGQNKPNPFTDQTNIHFVLPKDGEATLEIFDLNGKKFYSQTRYYQKGENIVEVYLEEVPASGIVYYQLTFGSHKATKKMVVIR